MKEEMLTLTTEWDKTFQKSDKVDHKKVTFHNRYGSVNQILFPAYAGVILCDTCNGRNKCIQKRSGSLP